MMQFSNIQEFIEMGGYAFNVWSVYALFVLFLAANLLLPLHRKKRIIKDLKRRQVVNNDIVNTGGEKSAVDTGTDSLGESI